MPYQHVLAGAAAIAALAAAAAPASATPVALTFDHVVVDTPGTPDTEAVSPSTQPLKVTADLDPATGDYTIQPADFDFPEYSFSSPVAGTIDVTLPSPASGHVDLATGRLSLTGTFDTKISLTGLGDCTKTIALTLTTETAKPLPGVPFGAGAAGVATGNGAFGAGWDTLPPGSGSACGLVDPVVAGAGGLWISRGIDPKIYETPAGAPKLSAGLKTPAKVKSGRKATLKATVTNTGKADASGVEVCLNAPKPLKPRQGCQTVGDLAAGKAAKLTFKVKTRKHKHGTYKLTLKASGAGIASASATTKLKVKKR